MFLGYDDNSIGYPVLVLANLKVVISDEVTFEEDAICYQPQNPVALQKFPFMAEPTDTVETDDFFAPPSVNEHPAAETIIEWPVAPQFAAEPIAEFPPAPPFAIDLPVEPLPPAEQLNEGDGGVVHNDNEIGEGVVATCANRRYPLHERTPKVIQLMNTMDFDNDPFEPGSFQEAMGCRQASLWQPSVLDEFSSLQQNGTWILVPLPLGRSAIGTRWDF